MEAFKRHAQDSMYTLAYRRQGLLPAAWVKTLRMMMLMMMIWTAVNGSVLTSMWWWYTVTSECVDINAE